MGRQKKLDETAATVPATQVAPAAGYGIKTIDGVIDLLEPFGQAACVTPHSMSYALWRNGLAAQFCKLLAVPLPDTYDAFREVAFAFFGRVGHQILLDGVSYQRLHKQELARDEAPVA